MHLRHESEESENDIDTLMPGETGGERWRWVGLVVMVVWFNCCRGYVVDVCDSGVEDGTAK